MRVLAIDPGARCGYAVTDEGKVEPARSGTWDLTAKPTERAGLRFVRLREHLVAMDPDVVLYERVCGHKGVAAAHVYGGMVAIIQAFCAERRIPFRTVHTAAVKKRATGKGNAPKDRVVAAALAHFGITGFLDDNRADALWILQCGLEDLRSAA